MLTLENLQIVTSVKISSQRANAAYTHPDLEPAVSPARGEVPGPPSSWATSQPSPPEGRRRPKSVEMGAKAKEAIWGFGKRAQEAVHKGSTATARPVSGQAVLGHDFKVAPIDLPSRDHTDRHIISATTVTTLRPPLGALALPDADGVLELDILSETSSSQERLENQIEPGVERWEEDVAFLLSPQSLKQRHQNHQRRVSSPRPTSPLPTTTQVQRAGYFEPLSSNAVGLADSGSDDEAAETTVTGSEITSSDRVRDSSRIQHQSYNAGKLQLQIRFPDQRLQDVVSGHPASGHVDRTVSLIFSLRTQDTSQLTPQPLSSRLTSTGQAPRGPRQLRPKDATAITTTQTQPRGILFLCCTSSARLRDAIRQLSRTLRDGAAVNLTSPSLTCIELPQSGSDTIEFSWEWTPKSRFEDRGEGCFYAFVGFSPDTRTPNVLLSHSFWLEAPSSSILGARHQASDSVRPRVLTDNSFPLTALDRTELTLEDVMEDTPLFRAAASNLERKTATLKKAGKVVLKACTDVKLHLATIQASQAALDESLSSLGALLPNVQHVAERTLFQDRSKEAVKREQDLQALDEFVELPVKTLVELCRRAQDAQRKFDAESKLYYTATQKWLAKSAGGESVQQASEVETTKYESASTSASNTQPFSAEILGEDEKQRIREHKFVLARLELYEALFTLHGGPGETNLARAFLAVSSAALDQHKFWSSPDSVGRLRAQIDSFELQFNQEMGKLSGRTKEIRDRSFQLNQILDRSRDIVPDDQKNISHQGEGSSSSRYQDKAVEGKPVANGRLRGLLQSFSNSVPTEGEAYQDSSAFKNLRQQMQARFTSHNVVSSNRVAALTSKWTSQSNAGSEPHTQPPGGPSRVAHAEALPEARRSPSRLLSGRVGIAPRRSVSMTGTSAPAAEAISKSRTADQSNAKPGIVAGVVVDKPTRRRLPSLKKRDAGDRMTPSMAPSPSFARQVSASSDRKKEGILWVMSKTVTGPIGAEAPKSANRAQHWHEAWVVLSGSGHLGEYADWKEKDSRSAALTPSGPVIDLRFATVREARGLDRRWTFEIVTRTQRRFYQASSERTMQEWISAVGKAIESLINGTSSIRQVDKVARHESVSPLVNGNFGTDDWGVKGGIVGANALGQNRPWSQSLTDLSSAASGGLGARLFLRNTANGGGVEDAEGQDSNKRRSRVSKHLSLSGHISTLSEDRSTSRPGNGIGKASPMTPNSKAGNRASVIIGISNRTPVSGYVGASPSASDASTNTSWLRSESDNTIHRPSPSEGSGSGSLVLSALRRAHSQAQASEEDEELDKRIEAMVQEHYGAKADSRLPTSSHAQHRSATDLVEFPRIEPPLAGQQGLYRNQSQSSKPRRVSQRAVSDKYNRAAIVSRLAQLPGNSQCFDCKSTDPRWASWSLYNQPCCVFLCIRCSGMHRGLGVHISKVRSVDLDDWNEEQVAAAEMWGNVRANAIWEAKKPEGSSCLPDFVGGDLIGKQFWQRKYVEQVWRLSPNAPLLAPVEQLQGSPPSDLSSPDVGDKTLDANAWEAWDGSPRKTSRQTRQHAEWEEPQLNEQYGEKREIVEADTASPHRDRRLSYRAGSTRRSEIPSRRRMSEQSDRVAAPPRSSFSLEPGGLFVDGLEVEGLPSPVTPSSDSRSLAALSPVSQIIALPHDGESKRP